MRATMERAPKDTTSLTELRAAGNNFDERHVIRLNARVEHLGEEPQRLTESAIANPAGDRGSVRDRNRVNLRKGKDEG
ncbi:hypothetical protein MLD38_025306 [Melastoma candidum]|uniref:Uncharacterized protein n=1 Tax=Melastoma candidum TaxID=119954 RepID=A0ACB9NWJ8_9MYRT|nr:hypothetical protein MLD38_025306 [Melastoma candidum]